MQLDSSVKSKNLSINFSSEKEDLNTLFYGISTTLFGQCLIAYHEEDIYFLSFFKHHDFDKALELLKQEYENYNFILDKKQAKNLTGKIFNFNNDASINLVLKGTDFQLKIWKELTKVPFGSRLTYSDFSKLIGYPKSTRAIASAIAKNRIAFFIPCHRIISKNSKIHKYRWGSDIKKLILEYEANPH